MIFEDLMFDADLETKTPGMKTVIYATFQNIQLLTIFIYFNKEP